MKKVAPLTDQITAALKRGVKDPSFDTSRVEVFEASFTTSRPLNTGGLFRLGRITKTGLDEMAAHLNGEGNAVPMHIEHNLGYGLTKEYLPIGKAFAASVVRADDGEYELRGYFYVDKEEHEDLVNKIESSAISELSIQAGWDRAISNKSGFNFLEKGNEDYAWDRTDNEGNRLGDDGHHVMISGLNKFYEVSLVGRGAAPGARIHAQRTFNLAAASTHDALATMTTLSAAPVESGDVTALTARVETLTTEKTALSTELETLKTEKTSLAATVATLTESATRHEGVVTALKADVKKASDELAEVATLLREHAQAAAVAAGLTLKDDATVAEMSALIKEASVKLHTLVPEGGRSRQLSDDPLEPHDKKRNFSAFRVRN